MNKDSKGDYLGLPDDKEEKLITRDDRLYSSHSPHTSASKNFDSHRKTQDVALRKLGYVSVICLIFMVIEIIGGYLANSIAIMSDAAHLLSDFLGFIISILSIVISRKVATTEMSFGFHRAEIIGALVSVTLIWGLTIWLLYEATVRIMQPPEVDGFIMLLVAIIGFSFNLIMGLVLMSQGVGHSHLHSHDHGCHGHDHDSHSHKHKHDNDSRSHKEDAHSYSKHSHRENEHDQLKNVNVRAAFIHIIGDALQNVGVVTAGLVIYFWPSLSIADPICTYIFSIIVVFTTIRILKDCISVLMEGSPVEFDIESLEQDLLQIPGVIEVHDLHVWSLSLGKMSLSCHLSSQTPQVSLKKARKIVKSKYKITHSTIQVELDSERNANDCKHDLHQ